jgi:hypothetical protein
MQKCNKFCERVEQEFERLLGEAGSKESCLSLTKGIIVIRFQHCAILSQLNKHDKALEMCQQTFPFLQKYIENILEYTESLHANSGNEECT